MTSSRDVYKRQGLLTPNKELKEAQDKADFTKVLQGLEEIKTLRCV